MEFEKTVLEQVAKIHSLFLAGHIRGPEKHEVNPGLPISSRENYLYFTLPCSLNFQRSSPAMWASALKTYEDPETRYLFFPEHVVSRGFEEVKNDIRKHNLAVQTNKHPMIWHKICQTLHRDYDDDPRGVLEEGGYDIVKVVDIVQRSKKKDFPFLSGIKLSNYWLFILHSFTDVQFNNVNEISIIPDTHIIKSTIRLGLAPDDAKAIDVEDVWRNVLRELDIPPTDMHTALWRWSRNGFVPGLV